MAETLWSPPDEATAASTRAVFIEWLRATRRLPQASPETLRAWAVGQPAGYAATLAAFAGLDPALSVRENLLRHRGTKIALIQDARSWSRDALRAGTPAAPAQFIRQLDTLSWDQLLALAAHHLLHANTHPDDIVPWTDAADPAALGALMAGAAVEIRLPPPGRDGR